MARDLTGIIGQKVEDMRSLAALVTTPEKAILAGNYLYLAIVDAEVGDNPHFCEKGVELLKRWYNSLCSRFPELAEQVHDPYNL